MSIETMKQALEALENPWKAKPEGVANAITALRQAIEQAEKQCQCPACKIKPHASDCSVHNEPAWPNGPCDCGAIEQAQKQEPRNIRERWNIELDGDDLLVCFNDHEKSEGCRYERYVLADTSPPKRQPLTDRRARDLWHEAVFEAERQKRSTVIVYKEKLEAAHGITGENNGTR
jgi:hypothetical protein